MANRHSTRNRISFAGFHAALAVPFKPYDALTHFRVNRGSVLALRHAPF
jgi:hypothetical protein